MRNIAIAFTLAATLAGPIALSPVMMTAAAAQTHPCPPDNPNQGGLQGRDCEGWNRMLETGARASARAMGRYPQPIYGYGVPQQRVYGGVPQGYVGGGYAGGGYAGGGTMRGPVQQSTITVMVAHPWRRVLTPNGWACVEGPCPKDRIYVNR